MITDKLRAWWWHCQGLDGSMRGKTPAQVLGATGWSRSVGGANPYLGLFARIGTRRAEVDAAVERLDIHELPVVRGCTYVLGAEDFAWGLQLGAGGAQAQLRTVERLGVPRAELDDLAQQTAAVLRERGPLTPQQLKEELGQAVRTLGEAGKKKGAATTLPAALGALQSSGAIRRAPLNGRLDQQRYAYTAWDLPPSGLSDEEARAAVVRRYLSWTGGATLGQSQWFTAFTVAQSRLALSQAGAVEYDGVWRLPADQETFEAFRAPQEEQIQLLAGTDGIALLKRNAVELLADEDAGRSTAGDRSLALQADLADHPILDRGRIIGLWQYDPGHQEIVAWTFRAPSAGVGQRIAEVEAYIREDLGDFRSFSLDSPAFRQKRIDALRASASTA
ncbi:DNA glycosylase AlkZ-like family protein [Psychromicrobium xiongbiense]|uniref:DNA glycosylase AlkZ-like family protein n=1 Tax=Psychromicrobium xiongbiense TaxID=3051184 RepID=UPI002555E38A|nr:crosslink repair DNA glycosylase YcaQ family protein [Psychromicrobium sp. YIM S02556]